MRKLTMLVPIAAALLAAAACSSSSPHRGGASNTNPTSTSVGVNSNVPVAPNKGQSYDGQNPGPSCGATGQVKNPYVVTVAGSTRTVKAPNGKVFGQLVLRHSTLCQTAWGEVFYSGKHEPAGFSITITVVRPHGSAPKTIPFTTTDFVPPAFSSMLANNKVEDGCVYASAHVTIDGRAGPTVTTNCSAS